VKKWFCYSPGGGFEVYNTRKEAFAAAKESLQYEADEAPEEGWPEETCDICWGEIKAEATVTMRRKATKVEARRGFSEIINYQLRKPC
jgi:hypothetical protein